LEVSRGWWSWEDCCCPRRETLIVVAWWTEGEGGARFEVGWCCAGVPRGEARRGEAGRQLGRLFSPAGVPPSLQWQRTQQGTRKKGQVLGRGQGRVSHAQAATDWLSPTSRPHPYGFESPRQLESCGSWRRAGRGEAGCSYRELGRSLVRRKDVRRCLTVACARLGQWR